MKLLIISPTPHALKNNIIVGHGATIKEINFLNNTLFEEITHIAPLYKDESDKSFLPYEKKVNFVPLEPAGGHSIKEKLRILRNIPSWMHTVKPFLYKDFDLIHIRTPSNITLPLLIYLHTHKINTLKWIKFAGNWENNRTESISSKLHKLILKKHIHRAFVTVNHIRKLPKGYFFAFPNPSYYLQDYLKYEPKIQSKHLSLPLKLLFVGNLMKTKGIIESLNIVQLLKTKGIKFIFHIIGTGPMENYLNSFIQKNSLQKHVTLLGALPHQRVLSLMLDSHFLLLPTHSEGWPKVVSEAMSKGTVPIVSNVSIMPDIVNSLQCGFSAHHNDIDGFVDAIVKYTENPDLWKLHSLNAYKYAAFFTYEYYGLKLVKTLVDCGFTALQSYERKFRDIKDITRGVYFPL